MVLYPTFFTPLEEILMNQYQIVEKINTTTNVMGSNNINQGNSKKFGGWYANFCYLLLIFMLITGFVDILAYGFHNSGDLNKNREMNLGITASQLSFGIIICLISILLVWWHCTTNTISYVEKIQKLLGDEGLEYSTLGQFKTSISDKGMKLKPYISWFAIILLILAFLYGVTIVIFSADRLLCTTTGSCSITKFTAEEKAALRV